MTNPIYTAAREGCLSYCEVRTSAEAAWARHGYSDRANDETLTADQRRFALDFVRNLDCDFA